MLPALHQLTSGLDILAAITNNKTAFEECFLNSNRKLVVEDLLGIKSTDSVKTEVISLKRKWVFTNISPTS